MHNYEIAEQFSLLSKLMDLHGENSFKVKSYSNAAFTLDKLPNPVKDMDHYTLSSTRGIGDAISKKIAEILQTGHLALLDEYLQKTPPGILEMFKIKGIGAKKIQTIWKELGIESIGELLYACNENRLIHYKGFGVKTQKNIQESLEFYLQHQGTYLYQQLEPLANALMTALTSQFPNEQHLYTGDFARQMETIESLSLVTTTSIAALNAWFSEKQFTCTREGNTIIAKGADNFAIHSISCNSSTIIATAFRNNCSDAFWDALTQLSTFNEAGFFSTPFQTEEELFHYLQLAYIPVYLREEAWIIEEVLSKKAVPNVIQTNDIKGIIHSHSHWSDGVYSIEDMAKAAIEKGLEYLVISDHSQSAFYANGLTVDRIRQQHQQIDQLNKKLAPFVIFKSIESDILNDGALDYEENVLDAFDLVIASIHSNLKMSEEKAMQRIMAAIENPYTSIIGHPTGRLLLSRKGYPVNHTAMIEACSANNVVIELNAHPRRLDMDWRYIREAIQKDVLISIDPDAHDIEGFEDCKYGVKVAQKAGLKPAQNLSSFDLQEMMEFISYQQEKRS